MDEEVEDFLAHYGVKGMKWGVRRTRRVQKQLDRMDRIAKGTASRSDKIKSGAYGGVVTSKSAEKTLQRGARNQAAVKAGTGKGKVLNVLALSGGVRMKDLDYGGRTGVSKNPEVRKSMERGDKMTKVLIGAGVGYMAVSALAAKKM